MFRKKGIIKRSMKRIQLMEGGKRGSCGSDECEWWWIVKSQWLMLQPRLRLQCRTVDVVSRWCPDRGLQLHSCSHNSSSCCSTSSISNTWCSSTLQPAQEGSRCSRWAVDGITRRFLEIGSILLTRLMCPLEMIGNGEKEVRLAGWIRAFDDERARSTARAHHPQYPKEDNGEYRDPKNWVR